MRTKRSELLLAFAMSITVGVAFALGCDEDNEQDNGSNDNGDESKIEAHFLSPGEVRNLKAP